MKLILCVLLLASAGLQLASAALCSSHLTEALCYTNRAADGCRYDPVAAVCTSGVPNTGTCTQYWRDTVGCALTASGQVCAINPWNNMCYKPIAACTTLSLAACPARSDCVISGTCVARNPLTPGSCLFNTNSPTGCTAAACFYDSFAPVAAMKTCTNSLAEVITNYPECSLWSYYPTANSPCTSHGCSYNPVTGICGVQTADGGAAPSTVSLIADFTVSGVVVDPLTLVMTGIVSVPVGQYFKPSSPRYHALVFGDVSTTAGVALAPGTCNSLLTAHPAFGLALNRINPPYPDSTDLLIKFRNAVTASQTLAFSTASPAANLAMYQTVGYNKVNKTDTSSILKTAATDGLTTVDLAFSVSLTGIAAAGVCPGVTTTVVPNAYTRYGVKMSMYVREGDNVVISNMMQTVTVYSYGLVQTGASSSNAVRYTLDPTVDTALGTSYMTAGVTTNYPACGAGFLKRVATIREIWTNPNNATLVGLRDLRDANILSSFSPGQLQVAPNPTNCFGTKVVRVVPPTFPCSGGTCTTLVTLESRCASVLSADGDGLNLCSYQTAPDRTADMGSDISYPLALNYKQNYFHKPREWTPATVETPTYVGEDSTGETGDEVSVSLSNKAYKQPDIASTLLVDCGFLPTPSSPIPVSLVGTVPMVRDVNFNPDVYDNTANIRNQQIKSSGSLAVGCWMRNPLHRAAYTVTIDTTPFSVRALDARGMVPIGYTPATLTWAQNIAPVLTHSPRSMPLGASLPPRMPGAVAALGFDGFALPAYWISQQLPSVGYMLKFGVSVSIPLTTGAGAGTVSTVVARRLLEVGVDNTNGTLNSGYTNLVYGADNSNTTNSHMLSIALGSSKSSTSVSLAVGGAVAAATAMALIVAYMTTAATTTTTVAIAAAAAVSGKFKPVPRI